MAEIDLRRSRLASDSLERLAWRRSAVERANALANRGDNAYPHHTLLKAAIDAVKDELAATETEDDEAITLRLNESVANAEAVLRKGLQAFPNEAVLLAEEGELLRVLSQAPRAEAAFEKAFTANPRSTLIARRLARIKRSKGAFAEAQQVLQKCLEYNPGTREPHYDFAMSIIESAPDADQTESDAALYHLRRSFSQGDKNRQAQFWYARELSIAGRYDEARPFFKALSEAHIPFKDKIEVRGILKTAEGEPRELVGTVTLLRETFGFVQCDTMHLSAFFSTHDDNQEWLEYLIPGGMVRFELGFCLRGPVVSRFNS
jgi:tetratricopeptide (TPR) repeat protein